MVIKLKTRKELEKIGYIYHAKSLFAPMSIDLAGDNARATRNNNRIIPMAIYKLLGKKVNVDSGFVCDGLEFFTVKIEGHDHGYNLPAIAFNGITFRSFKTLKEKEDKEKQKEAERNQIKVLTEYGYDKVIKHNGKKKLFSICGNDFSKSEARKIAKFILSR